MDVLRLKKLLKTRDIGLRYAILAYYRSFIYELLRTNTKQEVADKLDFNYSHFVVWYKSVNPYSLDTPILPHLADSIKEL